MNSQLQNFQYESQQLRIQQDSSGDPLFNANDLCALLHYSNPHDAVARHVDKDDRVKREIIDSMNRPQQANFLREPGMWALIMRSDAPNAKPVQRWVFAEVLPAIRKAGSYSQPTTQTYQPQHFAALQAELLKANPRLQDVLNLTRLGYSQARIGEMLDLGPTAIYTAIKRLRQCGFVVSADNARLLNQGGAA